MSPSPAQLVVNLLSAAAPEAVPVRALVGAAEVFGFTSNVLRVTLTRLGARGMVENVRRGEYALGPRAGAIQAEVGAWRRDDAAITTRWDGRTWLAAHGLAACPPVLRLLGFRELSSGLLVRPANRRGGVAGVRERLRTGGVAASVFLISELDAEQDALARGLWDVPAIVASEREVEARLRQSMQRLAGCAPSDAALRETFTLGGAAIRALALDPHLPEALCPPEPRRALRETMLRYDAFGLRLWSERLGRALDGHAPVLWEGSAAP